MLTIKYSMLAILLPVSVFAQTNGTFLLVSSNTVSPSTPTTTIEVWAAWDDPTREHAFGGGNYDLTAGDGTFLTATSMLGGVPSTAGFIAGNLVTGAAIGQVHLPGIVGNTDNPILLATYDWGTTDFTPRSVRLHTSNTTNFIVVEIVSGRLTRIELFPNNFTPGTGVITVVPAPAAWLVVALPFVAARRRRRC